MSLLKWFWAKRGRACLEQAKNGTVSISNPTVQLLQVLSTVFENIPKGSIVVAASDCILELAHG